MTDLLFFRRCAVASLNHGGVVPVQSVSYEVDRSSYIRQGKEYPFNLSPAR